MCVEQIGATIPRSDDVLLPSLAHNGFWRDPAVKGFRDETHGHDDRRPVSSKVFYADLPEGMNLDEKVEDGTQDQDAVMEMVPTHADDAYELI